MMGEIELFEWDTVSFEVELKGNKREYLRGEIYKVKAYENDGSPHMMYQVVSKENGFTNHYNFMVSEVENLSVIRSPFLEQLAKLKML